MLMIKRQVGQAIVITLPDGREVRIEVTGTGRHGVYLGFTADRDILIMREELLAPEHGEVVP